VAEYRGLIHQHRADLNIVLQDFSRLEAEYSGAQRTHYEERTIRELEKIRSEVKSKLKQAEASVTKAYYDGVKEDKLTKLLRALARTL